LQSARMPTYLLLLTKSTTTFWDACHYLSIWRGVKEIVTKSRVFADWSKIAPT